MAIARVRTVLTGLVEGGGLSTFLFGIDDPAFPVQDVIDKVGKFWDDAKAQISNGVTMTVNPTVDILAPSTGVLEGTKQGIVVSKQGTAAGNVMPPATQRLIRLKTNSIASGKRIQGKLYIPGAVIPAADTQVVPANVQGVLQGAAINLVLTPPQGLKWCVWSRTNGVAYPITSANVWSKYAVLRSRRD